MMYFLRLLYIIIINIFFPYFVNTCYSVLKSFEFIGYDYNYDK